MTFSLDTEWEQNFCFPSVNVICLNEAGKVKWIVIDILKSRFQSLMRSEGYSDGGLSA